MHDIIKSRSNALRHEGVSRRDPLVYLIIKKGMLRQDAKEIAQHSIFLSVNQWVCIPNEFQATPDVK
jgi:hypothetical protein